MLNDIFFKYDSDKGPRHHNYGGIYEFILGPHRSRPIKLLEIGYTGASILSWLEYLPQATIIGLNIDTRFNPDSDRVHVEIGSQADITILERLIKRYGPFDFVIDDGEHSTDHQQPSFKTLFPAINPGGAYIIEDLEVSRVQSYQRDGYRPTIQYLEDLIEAGALCTGKSDPWIIFAGEFVAVFKR